MILHPTENRVLAVLVRSISAPSEPWFVSSGVLRWFQDWELSTLGHPTVDLAYNCMPYHIPNSFGQQRHPSDFVFLFFDLLVGAALINFLTVHRLQR
jgi:hypothetical protein